MPIEAKGRLDKSAKSIKNYIENRKPVAAIRFSKMEYMKNGQKACVKNKLRTTPLFWERVKKPVIIKITGFFGTP